MNLTARQLSRHQPTLQHAAQPKLRLLPSRRTQSRGPSPFSTCAQEVSSVVLPPQNAAQLDRTCRLLEKHIQGWLDEEWTPMDQHARLAMEAVQAYRALREDGEDDLSSLLLGIGSELMDFDFKDTFTDSFEVANKLAALLMQQENLEVCCQTPEEQERYERVEQMEV